MTFRPYSYGSWRRRAGLALSVIMLVSMATSSIVASTPAPAGGPPVTPAAVALPPAAGEKGVEQRISDMEARSAAGVRPLPDTYHKAGYTPRPLTGTSLPYNSPNLYGYDRDVPRDPTGVRMFPVAGVLYDHPVAQAQDGLMSLSDYRLTGEARYLDRAVLNAQRLIDRRVLSDDAWYYPYPFDFRLHGLSSDTMRAPWFSGMAQGQVLSLFSRLYRVTGDQAWRDAADTTFNSFRNAPARNLPSTVNIDPENYLWLEEFPRWPTTTSDRTLNGHLYSAFGLYDYFQLTGNPAARDMWNGALANVRHHLEHDFRSPNYASHYCLSHGWVRSPSYHEDHWTQMIWLHASTGDSIWSRYADILRADYPPPAVSGTVIFEPGAHTGYKFTRTGVITARKTIQLTRRSSAPANARKRVLGRGVMLRITAGPLAGYSVPENHLRARMAGIKLSLTYPLQRTVFIPAGSWSAYRYNTDGTRTARKTIRPTRTTSAPVSASAVINGRWHVHVTAGSLAGYWLPASAMTLV